MRDYNEILDGGEHSEFEVSPRIPLGMQEFQEIMRNYKLKIWDMKVLFLLGVISVEKV